MKVKLFLVTLMFLKINVTHCQNIEKSIPLPNSNRKGRQCVFTVINEKGSNSFKDSILIVTNKEVNDSMGFSFNLMSTSDLTLENKLGKSKQYVYLNGQCKKNNFALNELEISHRNSDYFRYEYFDDGEVKNVKILIDSVNSFIDYYPNGNIKYFESYSLKQNAKLFFKSYSFYSTGVLKTIYSWELKKSKDIPDSTKNKYQSAFFDYVKLQDDTTMSFDKNGNLAVIDIYKSGIKQRELTYYLDEKNVSIVNFTDGKRKDITYEQLQIIPKNQRKIKIKFGFEVSED
jgi:hypothetical protein